jgi:error-prone DNA polymerase
VSYAELHCTSNFSFLEGAAHPEELAEVAAALGLSALAITDRNGLYGVVRFAEAARAVNLPTIFGVELDCAAGDIVLLARGPSGYARMARAKVLPCFLSPRWVKRCVIIALCSQVGAPVQ